MTSIHRLWVDELEVFHPSTTFHIIDDIVGDKGTLTCGQFLDLMIDKFLRLQDRASCRNQMKRNKIQHTYEDNCL